MPAGGHGALRQRSRATAPTIIARSRRKDFGPCCPCRCIDDDSAYINVEWRAMSTTQLRQPKNRCAQPCSSRTVELRLAPQTAQRTAAVAGNFTAWVPVEMVPAADGGFVLRVCVQRKMELSCRVLVDDERWTVDDISVVDLGRRTRVSDSNAWRTANSAFVRARSAPRASDLSRQFG